MVDSTSFPSPSKTLAQSLSQRLNTRQVLWWSLLARKTPYFMSSFISRLCRAQEMRAAEASAPPPQAGGGLFGAQRRSAQALWEFPSSYNEEPDMKGGLTQEQEAGKYQSPDKPVVEAVLSRRDNHRGQCRPSSLLLLLLLLLLPRRGFRDVNGKSRQQGTHT